MLQQDPRDLGDAVHGALLARGADHHARTGVGAAEAVREECATAVVRALMHREPVRTGLDREDTKTHVASHEGTTSAIHAVQHADRRLVRHGAASLHMSERMGERPEEARDIARCRHGTRREGREEQASAFDHAALIGEAVRDLGQRGADLLEGGLAHAQRIQERPRGLVDRPSDAALHEVLEHHEAATGILEARAGLVHHAHGCVTHRLIPRQQVRERRHDPVGREAVHIVHVERLVVHQVRHLHALGPIDRRAIERAQTEVGTACREQRLYRCVERDSGCAEVLDREAGADRLAERRDLEGGVRRDELPRLALAEHDRLRNRSRRAHARREPSHAMTTTGLAHAIDHAVGAEREQPLSGDRPQRLARMPQLVLRRAGESSLQRRQHLAP